MANRPQSQSQSQSLTRYPVAGFTGINRLSQMLDQMFGPADDPSALTSAWLPAVDVMEDDENVRIVAEIPGVRPEDVQLSLENNVLTIRGEKRQEVDQRNERFHRYERSYGIFERSFLLPSNVDPDRIEARYDAGVLTVTVPKSERARPRQIEVKTSQEIGGQSARAGQEAGAQSARSGSSGSSGRQQQASSRPAGTS